MCRPGSSSSWLESAAAGSVASLAAALPPLPLALPHAWPRGAPGPPIMPRCERRRCLERECEMEVDMKASHSLSNEPCGELPSGEELACARSGVGRGVGRGGGRFREGAAWARHTTGVLALDTSPPVSPLAPRPPTCECGSATAAAASAEGLRRMRWPWGPYTVTAA